MAFDWRDFMTVASTLAQNTDEASLRSAVSRAYYAVYHTAVTEAPKHQVRIVRLAGQSDHEACWLSYKTVPAVVQVGLDGDRLKKQRHDADYRQTAINWTNQAAASLILAKRILGQL